MQVYENLIAHGYQLPESLTPAGLYVPVNRVGNLVFISGQGSIFKGENHELSRSGRPYNRIKRIREITAWMDCYLQPDCN